MDLRSSLPALALLCVACASPPAEDPVAGDDEVVGVEDIAALEAELGMARDERLPDGRWSRDVTKGGCYARGQAASPRWEFRRWKTGAAFFQKRADAPGGDSREIVCVDLDDPYDASYPHALDRLALDVIVRFHLGGFVSYYGEPQTVITEFERGRLVGPEELRRCQSQADWSEECAPLRDDALDRCLKAVIEACLAEYAELAANPTLARPSANGHFEALVLRDGETRLRAPIAAIAARYAAKHATSINVFNMATDPIGAFVGFDGDVARFEKAEIEDASDEVRDVVTLRPRGAAPVRCARAWSSSSFDCEQSGGPLAP